LISKEAPPAVEIIQAKAIQGSKGKFTLPRLNFWVVKLKLGISDIFKNYTECENLVEKQSDSGK